MTWQELLVDGHAERHTTNRRELDELRSVVARNLADAAIPNLSADNRFGLAYEAALQYARMAIACAGYRIKGTSAHRTTFDALELAMGSRVSRAASYFDRCRRKRNTLSYDMAGVATDTEVREIIRETRSFGESVESWIVGRHPDWKIGP